MVGDIKMAAKRFAQLEPVAENVKRIHWVFEADEKPEFAPYIEIIEVPPNVREGMFYLENEDRFVEPFDIPQPPALEDRISALEDALLLLLMEV